MPSEYAFNVHWVFWTAVLFASKGFIFAILARMVSREYSLAFVRPTPVASCMIRLFSALTIASAVFSSLLFNSWYNLPHLTNYPDDDVDPVRAGIRLAVSVSIVLVSSAGIHLALNMRQDARRAAAQAFTDVGRAADASERTANATERIADRANETVKNGHAGRSAAASERLADQGDVTHAEGDSGRSAAATERIADAGEGIATKG